MSLTDKLKGLATVDIFKEGSKKENFVGRPFSLDYDRTNLLICDAWKTKVGGVPQGSFLLAFYDNENDTGTEEALLLRAIKPVKLPTDSDVISSMIEYYKDNLKTSGKKLNWTILQDMNLVSRGLNVEYSGLSIERRKVL